MHTLFQISYFLPLDAVISRKGGRKSLVTLYTCTHTLHKIWHAKNNDVWKSESHFEEFAGLCWSLLHILHLVFHFVQSQRASCSQDLATPTSRQCYSHQLPCQNRKQGNQRLGKIIATFNLCLLLIMLQSKIRFWKGRTKLGFEKIWNSVVFVYIIGDWERKQKNKRKAQLW